MTKKLTIFGFNKLELFCREDLCLAISFDYLIIPLLTPGYEYYPELLTNLERIKLHMLSRRSHYLTTKISLHIQIRDNPINRYFNSFYSMSKCWFVRCPRLQMTGDIIEWRDCRDRLDNGGPKFYRFLVRHHYFDSLARYRKQQFKQLLDQYHLDLELTLGSCSIGYLLSERNTIIPNYSVNPKPKRNKKISKTRQIFNSSRQKGNQLKSVDIKKKYVMLRQLICSRLVCRYPGCRRLCFLTRTPHFSCVEHRYLETLVKDRVIWPSTKQLLELEESITIV